MTPRERYRRQEARDRATAQRLAGLVLKLFEDEMVRDRTTMAVATYMEIAIATGRASEAAKRLRAAKGTGAAKARRAYGVRRGSW